MRAGRQSPGASFGRPSEVPAEISEERNPALAVPCSRSPSLEGFCLIYQLGINIRDWLDCRFGVRDVDLDSAALTAPAQVIEVSVQGSVEVPPVIDAGQAPTMDNVIPAPQCATLIMYAHAPPLASTANQLLLTSTSAAAALLVLGPSFPPRTQGPINMLPGAPDSLLRGTSSAASGIQSAWVLPAPCRAPHYSLLAGMLWPSQPTPYASALMAPPAWPMYMPSYMPRSLTQQAFMQAEFEELASSAKT